MHLLMLLVTFCWASNIIAGKEALTGFGSVALAQVRVLCVAIIFALCFLPRVECAAFTCHGASGCFLRRWR